MNLAVQGVFFAFGGLQLADDVLDVLAAGFVCHQHRVGGFHHHKILYAHQGHQAAVGMY